MCEITILCKIKALTPRFPNELHQSKDTVGVYLDPANPKYTRLRPERSMTIGGIVKAVVRKYA